MASTTTISAGQDTKPRLATREIWNMSVGFLGIQAGFALQNGNASSILQRYGANVHELPNFWLVAPVIGMIVQPIIGHYSDRTWTRFGRRKPFFLAGAIAACIGMILMPNAGALAAVLPLVLMGAGMLMIMDASFNVAMEPFRALVADKLPSSQRTQGFSAQTALIGFGAVIGSWLPWFLANVGGVADTAGEGLVPDNVKWSFYIGGFLLLAAVLWTIFTTKEYPPKQQNEYAGIEAEVEKGGLGLIFKDLLNMPKTMRQLGWVQFFSWFGLFSMWVFTTPAIAHHVYGCAIDDTTSQAYSDAGNWTGIIFGVYNLVSAIFALMLPAIAARLGRKRTHSVSLICGGIGLISIYFATSPTFLIFSMIGVGIAWASILAMPYAMLAGSLPSNKMGVYMGIFNFFITIPQIVSGVINRPIVHNVFGNNAIYAIVMAGVFFLLAAASVSLVEDKDDVVQRA
ncbi:MAG TPA: MFS transporter [Saprospiraceae bacterium]|nr:MFS transporter [Saprospiraceae bacterium]HPI06842.1 MFS transporter [Saprospiraceae bacterium]